MRAPARGSTIDFVEVVNFAGVLLGLLRSVTAIAHGGGVAVGVVVGVVHRPILLGRPLVADAGHVLVLELVERVVLTLPVQNRDVLQDILQVALADECERRQVLTTGCSVLFWSPFSDQNLYSANSLNSMSMSSFSVSRAAFESTSTRALF